MKITRSQLKRIIKEESSRISEANRDPYSDPDWSAAKVAGVALPPLSSLPVSLASTPGPLFGVAGVAIALYTIGLGLETKELIQNVEDENSAKAYIDATTRAIVSAIKRALDAKTVTQQEAQGYHSLIKAMKLGKVRDPKARAMIMGDMLELVEKEDVAYAKSGILDSGEAMIDVDAVRADLDIWWNMIKNKYDEGNTQNENKMKITRKHLKQLITEELGSINEDATNLPTLEELQSLESQVLRIIKPMYDRAFNTDHTLKYPDGSFNGPKEKVDKLLSKFRERNEMWDDSPQTHDLLEMLAFLQTQLDVKNILDNR